jgi:hypothetical protein
MVYIFKNVTGKYRKSKKLHFFNDIHMHTISSHNIIYSLLMYSPASKPGVIASQAWLGSYLEVRILIVNPGEVTSITWKGIYLRNGKPDLNS